MTECLKSFSDNAINKLLAIALEMVNIETITIGSCPHCISRHIVRNGNNHGKQCFLCKGCGRTFVTTTHTVMSTSYYPATLWKKVVADILGGNAIDYTAKRLELSH